MATKLTSKYKLLNAKKVLDIFSSTTDRIYCFLGKVSTWSSDPPNPDPIVDSLGSDIEHWDDFVYAKQVSTNDVSLVIPYKEWQTGTVYDPYEHDVDLSTKNWYITDGSSGRVYKCISNNANTPSTQEPTATGTALVVTSDGYHWKYMYTATNVTTFQTNDVGFKWFPINELLMTNGSTQWDVQEAAVGGEINHIKSTKATPEFNYTIGDAVVVYGNSEGSGFTGVVTAFDSDTNYINITNAGSGYTNIHKIEVGGVDKTSELKAIISPISGHGFNAARELDTYALMVTCEFLTNEPELGNATEGYNEFRKIGLAMNPIVSWGSYDTVTTGGTSISSGTRYLSSTADQRIQINWTVAGDAEILAPPSETFLYDEGVYQGADLDNATARGYITSKDRSNRYMYLVTTHGTFVATSDIKTISNSDTLSVANINSVKDSAGVSSTVLYPLKRYSGDVLYIDQRSPITRTSGKETVRLVIQF